MAAKWSRVAVSQVPSLEKKGMLVMGTVAKKHLTIFVRKRRAKGAGRQVVKDKFAEIARTTGGEPIRSKRNTKLQAAMKAAGLKTGVYYKRSRSKYPPLAGKFYKLAEGQTVAAAIATAGLEATLSAGRGAV